jgi:hypothetical protein
MALEDKKGALMVPRIRWIGTSGYSNLDVHWHATHSHYIHALLIMSFETKWAGEEKLIIAIDCGTTRCETSIQQGD